jgi:hypothetical protein
LTQRKALSNHRTGLVFMFFSSPYALVRDLVLARASVKVNKTTWACSSTVEQGTHNPLVAGSNPAGPTTVSTTLAGVGALAIFTNLGKKLGFHRQAEREH